MAKQNEVAQTHTVHTDALGTIGMLISKDAGRDAIHLAVEPVVAGEILYPGQHIGLVNGKASAKPETLIGIVDPFLVGPVFPDQDFWLVVYPRTITSLRHVWEHPAFPKPNEKVKGANEGWQFKTVETVIQDKQVEKDKAETWLFDWCAHSDGPEYGTLLEAVKNMGTYVPIDGSDYSSVMIDGSAIHVSGDDAYGEIPDAFWDNMEIVLDQKIRTRPKYFSCAC